MAQMIPKQISSGTKSAAERSFFNFIRDAEGTEDWITFNFCMELIVYSTVLYICINNLARLKKSAIKIGIFDKIFHNNISIFVKTLE